MRKHLLVVIIASLALIAVKAMPACADDTVALPGNHPVNAETMPSAGNADPSQPLTMEIHFAVRNQAELNKLLAEQQTPGSQNFHKWLTPDEYNERFGPRPADIEAVSAWLKLEGFKVDSATDGYIKFSGNVSQAQQSFRTRIARFGNGSTYANVDDPFIPARFKGVIGSILGLDNMTRAVPLVHPPKSPKPYVAPSPSNKKTSRSGYAPAARVAPHQDAFGPQDMRIFYNETVSIGSLDGSGGCISIVGTADALDSALAAFQNQFMTGEPDIKSKVTRVKHGRPEAPGSSAETEAELDLEWSHAVAPGAAIKFHVGENLMNDIAGAVADTCDVVSISFGFCGPPSGYAKAVDNFMKKGAALGKSIFVSAGDSGSAGNPNPKNCDTGTSQTGQNVSEMAADPNVTAVGGTQFNPTYDQNHIVVGYSNNEQVWQASDAATGGGVSDVYAKPTYQSGSALAALGVPNDGKRDLPDIALIAGAPGVYWGHHDPLLGTTGVTCCLGGTSLSAPVWAGFIRVLSQKLGKRPGPMNPIIYQLALAQYGAQGAANGFHDITIGNNGINDVPGFNAGPGFDLSTGWGTIDFDVFADAVQNIPPPPPGPLTAPQTVTFGKRKVGTAVTKTITLSNPKKNKTTAQLTADAILTNHTGFTIVSAANTCTSGKMLAAGGKCTVRVMFRPQSAGTLTDTLTFSHNAQNGPQQQVTVTGIGK